MKAFRITGTFLMGRKRQPFTLETLATDEAGAREWVMSVLGSRHRASRRQIEIGDIHSEKPSEVEDAALKYALEHEDEYLQRKAEGGHV